jgi:6-pyruvoyltetrahydropterin/6-carboxytetrahydropterin synthase
MNDGLKIELGRRYRFAASHRLHTKKLGEEENSRIYGKCNNPYGHGHNYVLEIRVSGEIDPATGMLANLADLDAFVDREVIEPFDQRSLNEDVAAFREKVPTTENLCIEIFERLKKFPKAKLETVRIQETANNSFEYSGK